MNPEAPNPLQITDRGIVLVAKSIHVVSQASITVMDPIPDDEETFHSHPLRSPVPRSFLYSSGILVPLKDRRGEYRGRLQAHFLIKLQLRKRIHKPLPF